MKKNWILILFILFLFSIFFSFGGVYLYAKMTPKLSIKGANGYFIYDNEDNSINSSSNDWVNLDDISTDLINSTISIEDKNFYKHFGFDFLRILKALLINVKNKSNSQGASTITQQLSKNLFLDFDKTWSRKVKEAFITLRLETHYSKDKILEGYLNTINYGGIFGIERASNYYFGKKASELDLAESSILAGIPKNPSKYSPLLNYNKAKERQKLILDSMVKNSYISSLEAEEAYNEELIFKRDDEENNSNMILYYQDAVLKELSSISSIPSSFIQTGGIKIYTNLDVKTQRILEECADRNITNSDIELASIIMDPNDGRVLALTGGRDYDKSEFNRAISSKRQVGSTIKPFLYYSALENGFTPSTTFTSERTTFSFEGNKTYSPKNYNDKYADGPISLAAAISYSDNVYAVKTHLFLGDGALTDILKRVGIPNKFNNLPSLALGAEEIDLLSMMGAYSSLANEGYKINPYFIRKITDMDGNVLYEHEEIPELILNKSTVYILNELLTTTYAKEFTSYNVPTCLSIFPKMTHKYAVKSGTTDTDNLIFGYNKNLLVGIWTGYDDNETVSSKDSSNIKNMWVDIMEEYLEGKSDEETWYKTPSNVVGALIDPISGKAVSEGDSGKILYYIKGTEPTIDKKSLDDVIPTIKSENEKVAN
ncbi:MAG: PBP1A family penicillin-binding protein [Bacilli bacterium]|nr:PBP1A family penicillin-binding protein [Bacilli bacterium]